MPYQGSATGEELDRAAANAGGIKVYRAIMNQGGENAPVVNVIQNTIGEIVWTRTGTGQYRATLEGAFPSGKVFGEQRRLISMNDEPGSLVTFRISNNILGLHTVDDNLSFVDEMLIDTPITIIVAD